MINDRSDGNIMLVEDDIDIAESLVLFFQHQNYLVKHIDDGALAVQSVKDFHPDIIIMDLMLPNQDGITC